MSTPEVSAQPTIAVVVCTYKRPRGLARVLEALDAAALGAPLPVTCVVVDNDGGDPEVGHVVESARARVAYSIVHVVERTPGISAARNRAIAETDRLGATYVAMLDDDEWPTPGWLAALVASQRKTGAAVVGGPVAPEFPGEQGHLTRYARYWSVLPQVLEGKPFVFCSCNFLVHVPQLADVPRPLFLEEFGLTGGGDTAFFRGLFYRHKAMAWADDALLYEEVPKSRASLEWMRFRKYRVGNHAVRWESLTKSRPKVLAKTLGLCVRLPIYPLFRREPESPLVGWRLELEKVRGRVSAHLGRDVVEYARTPPAPGMAKACR
jgi:succinoglycan biosynthesis protein ExoM